MTAPDLPETADRRTYVATVSLLSLLGLVYVIECMTALATGSATGGLDPPAWNLTAFTLDRMGALSAEGVLVRHEWWRLLMAPLLHAGPAHILFNAFALWIISPRLEGLLGPGRLLAIFAASCLVGDLFSLLLNPVTVVSVGASGGILGLFAAAAIVSFGIMPGPARTALQLDALRLLIPALIPALLIPLTGGAQDGVDVAAHLGAAIGGLLIGLPLFWRQRSMRRAGGEPDPWTSHD